MNRIKKVLCVALVLVLLFASVPAIDLSELGFGMTASALNATGKCGKTATYTFDSATGKLTIEGTGKINAEAFKSNPDIKEVVIDDGITEIGADAFNQSSISNILIGNDVTVIGNGAFWYCYNLTSIDIPDNIISIGDTAFGDCNMLSSVNIGDGVTTIGDYAFASCSKLTTIEIGDSITTINTGIFHGCDCLANVYYAGSAEEWNAINIKYDNNSLNNATIHFAETHTHTWDVEEITKDPTCTEKGEKVIKCKNAICEKLEEIPATGHEWIHASCTTPKTCNKCGVTEGEALGHIFTEQKLGEKYLKTPATCGKKAVYYYSCSVCGESSANTAEEKTFEYGTAPDHNWGTAVKIAATCTEDEMMVQTCSRCNQKYVKKTSVKALGHAVHAEYTIDIAATCLEAGKKSKHCVRCDYKEGETTIPALGHDYQLAALTEATCLVSGYAKFTCTRCADTYEEAVSPALGHNIVRTPAVEATCTEFGYTSGIHCDRCNVVLIEQKKIEKLKHDYIEQIVNATCIDAGLITYSCKTCGLVKESTIIPALGHSFTTEKVIIKAPTCIAEGKKAIRCERCHAIEPGTEEIVPATHSYPDKWSVVIAPDCQNTGFAVKVCFNCHDVIAQTVPKSGHADLDGDRKCDTCEMIIVVEPEEPTEPDTPDIPDVPEEKPCDCDCHAGGIKAFFFNFLNFFAKLFDKSARVCKCGASH